MREQEFMLASREEGEYALEKLQYWLKYGNNTLFLGGLAFWLPYGFIFAALTYAAVVFTPYLLWRLIEARWFKAVTIFAVLVLIPLVVGRIVPPDGAYTSMALLFGPLVFFYLFTWILKGKIDAFLQWKSEERMLEYEKSNLSQNPGPLDQGW